MLTTKKICGNCRVSPRDGLSLISSPYEVSTGIWQVLYEAGNPRWRFLLSWNILSAIVHQRERCTLLDDPCHCVIKLIISLNSLVVLAVFSKNLSVPVFLWLVGREKSSISVIYWQNTALPHFSVFKLCCSRWHHYEGTDRLQCRGILCPLFQLGLQGSGGHICITPRLYFSITITAQLGFHKGVCWARPVFRHRPGYPAGVQMKYEPLLSCIRLLRLQHSWDSNQPALAVFYIPHLHGSTAGEGCSPLYHLCQSITAWASTSLRAICLNWLWLRTSNTAYEMSFPS